MSILRRNAVRVIGDTGKPLVLVHGFGGDQTIWSSLIPAFENEHRVVLLDLTGAGSSDLSAYDHAKYATLEGHATDVTEVIEELGLTDTILIGHSVSAMIVALAANRIPHKVDRIVMIGPSPRYIDDGDYVGGFSKEDIDDLVVAMDENYYGWSSQMAPAIMNSPDAPQHEALLTKSFQATDPDIARHFAELTFKSDHREDVRAIKHPALILQCSDDVIAPDAVGDWMAANTQNGVFVKLKASGHCPHVSAPQETIDAILPFLK